MMELRKEFFANERDDNLSEIGKPTRRQDILGHVTGRSPYFDDHLFEGLLHIRCVRSPHHHANIRRIDVTEAQAMPGVVRVLVGRDVPRNLNTLLSLLDFGIDDEPLLAESKVAYKGEPVAAVIAETEAQARAAVARVRVDWDVRPHVLDVEDAIKPGAPVVCEVYPANKFVYHGRYDHQKLRYGDVEAAFARADHIVEGRYQMSPIEQAPIETCGAIAAPEVNDRFVCYTSTQALFFSLGTAAKVLTMPSNRLHFVGGTVGGGFGGKVDSLHEPIAILGAMLTGRPCKFAWDREEEMQVGAPRGAERWYIKDGVARDGRILARKFTGYFDSGAYTRLSSYAIIKAAGHLPGPYTIPNVYADIYCVYTNRTPATAMRGFGITGVDFAIEAHMDKVADVLGMNPIDLRILNAYRDGDMKAHRREAKNTALIECCQVVAEKAGIALQPASRAASSLRDGGGERARLPAHTARDQHGAVSGIDTGGYARKAGGSGPAAQPGSMPAFTNPPAPGSARMPPRPSPAAPSGSQPPAPPTPAPPANTTERPRQGGIRFSSISGLRRR
ncbi:MAG: molybdopterin cofactor-binding domain-containing protein [Hyphomicrobiaceae bacterium]|nr:molybdopterin cofactor-binding domain-containing protein [Hyphomicrobiaceae bacterium]